MVRELYERVKEHEDRPKAIETLNTITNYTEHFLVNMKNFTGEDQPFTEVEYGTLEKLISGIKVSKFSFQHPRVGRALGSFICIASVSDPVFWKQP